MIYSFSYHLPNDYKHLEHTQTHNYNDYMQLNGLKEIAKMLHRDFKYEAYGIDHWSGSQQYRIELVVFSRPQWSAFLKAMKVYLEPWQLKKLHEEIEKQLEHGNK